MKKFWLILLAVTLVIGLAVIGCGGGGNNDDPDVDDPSVPLVEKTVFDMATDEGIQALTVGALTFGEGDGGANPFKPLVRAGGDSNITIEAIAGPASQKIALKFTVDTGTTWGAGIDLPYAAFGFRDGDVVTVKGKVTSGNSKVQLNSSVGAENAIADNGLSTGDFELKATLTAANVTAIKGASPSAIRLECRTGGGVVEVYNITIVGKRPATIAKLATPVITLTETGVSWEAIEGAGGYKVFYAEGAEFSLLTTTTPSAKAINLKNMDSLDDGTYKIKIVAVGVSGVSSDSDESNVVTFTKETPAPTTSGVKVGGTVQQVQFELSGQSWANNKPTLTTSDVGYTLEWNDAGNADFDNVYALFKINLGSDVLADFDTVTFDLTGYRGDLGYKSIGLYVSDDIITGQITSSYLVSDTKDVNNPTTVLDDPVSITLTIDPDKATSTENEFYVSIFMNVAKDKSGEFTKYEISNIEFAK